MPYCANLVGIWPSQVLIDTFVQFGRATPEWIVGNKRKYRSRHNDIRSCPPSCRSEIDNVHCAEELETSKIQPDITKAHLQPLPKKSGAAIF